MSEDSKGDKDKSLKERKEFAVKHNLQVLSRYYAGIRSIRFYAHNVCVYAFDAVNKCWKRSEIEGAFHIVDTDTKVPYKIIILNRKELDNLCLELIPHWTRFEEVQGTIQIQLAEGNIYALWFFDEDERKEAVSHLSQLLQPEYPRGRQEGNNVTDDVSHGYKLPSSPVENNAKLVKQLDTPEKEILRLLRTPTRTERVSFGTNGGGFTSPLSTASPFPSNKNKLFKNKTTGNTSSPEQEAGKHILSLLKNEQSPSAVNSDRTKFKVGACTENRNLVEEESALVNDSLVCQLEAALQAMARFSIAKDASWHLTLQRQTLNEPLEKGENRYIPSAIQLRKILSIILNDDHLFSQFYEQYVKYFQRSSVT
eukprot:jgi/Galph1/911/GphlegSOOS_G5693.1